MNRIEGLKAHHVKARPESPGAAGSIATSSERAVRLPKPCKNPRSQTKSNQVNQGGAPTSHRGLTRYLRNPVSFSIHPNL